MLTLLRNLHLSSAAARRGAWKKLPGRELAEVTVGVVGYGHVGTAVCDRLVALGAARVLANDIQERVTPPSVTLTSLDELLMHSDIVTVHVSMEPMNYHMLNDVFFSKMKEGAILINTARGSLLDEESLLKAIDTGKVQACALDVLEDEPRVNDALAVNEHVILSCHQGGTSNRAIRNMGEAAIEDLLSLLGISALHIDVGCS